MNEFQSVDLRLAGRAVIVLNKKLLLVSNDESYWYLPGGRIDPGENLKACIKREVFEECGLEVVPHDLWKLTEFFDLEGRIHSEPTHKVECLFWASIEKGELDPHWVDSDKSVRFRRYFSLEELKGISIFPEFLLEGDWLSKSSPCVYTETASRIDF
jgi:8-oxo-dGTP diphosphatase